jgi:hypothetical protein
MREKKNETGIPQSLERSEVTAIVAHGVFFVLLGLVFLGMPSAWPPGWRMFVLVIIYPLAMFSLGLWLKDREWLKILGFCMVLSIFQIFPDWFLATQLDILVFPEDGFFRIGAVSGYMAGLWTIPMFQIIFFGQRIKARFSYNTALIAVAVTTFLLFALSEETFWLIPSWHAKNVTMIHYSALYLLIPEVIFGLSGYFAYEKTKDKGLWMRILAAFFVMTFYIGNLSFFYFVIERLIK